MAHKFKPFPKGVNTPLRTNSVILCIRVVYEVCVEFVQTVISQVDVFLLPKISVARLVVLLRSEPRKSVFVDIDSEWIDWSNSNVDAQIKFIPIDEQWLANVLTNDYLSLLGDIVDVLGQKDTLALGRRSWFTDPCHLRFFSHWGLELDHLGWKNERFRQEFEMSFSYYSQTIFQRK